MLVEVPEVAHGIDRESKHYSCKLVENRPQPLVNVTTQASFLCHVSKVDLFPTNETSTKVRNASLS